MLSVFSVCKSVAAFVPSIVCIIITTTNTLNDYEIGMGTREQETRKYSNRRQSVLPQCQTGADA